MTKQSSIKFLVDESVEFKVVEYLRSEGFDVVAISEVCPSISDRQVLSKAFKQKRVLVTNDLGFGILVFKEELASHGVILIRMPDREVMAKIKRFEETLITRFYKLPVSFTTVTEKRIRPRSLPNKTK